MIDTVMVDRHDEIARQRSFLLSRSFAGLGWKERTLPIAGSPGKDIGISIQTNCVGHVSTTSRIGVRQLP